MGKTVQQLHDEMHADEALLGNERARSIRESISVTGTANLHRIHTTECWVQPNGLNGKTTINLHFANGVELRLPDLDAADCRALAEMLLKEAARQTSEARTAARAQATLRGAA